MTGYRDLGMWLYGDVIAPVDGAPGDPSVRTLGPGPLQALAGNLNPFVNVKDPRFGAKGDGTTDDYASIQSALDYLTTGGIVYMPPGRYRCTGVPAPKYSNTHIVGAGQATILASESSTYGFDFRGPSAGVPLYDCRLAHLQIRRVGTSAWYGIAMRAGAWRTGIEDILIIPDDEVLHTGVSGMTFASDAGYGGSYWNQMIRVRTFYCDLGFDLSSTVGGGGGLQQNANTFICCNPRDGHVGYKLGNESHGTSCLGNQIIGGSIEGYDQYGIDCQDNTITTVLRGVYFEGKTGSAAPPVRFRSGAHDNSFRGMILASGAGEGLNQVVDEGLRNDYEAIVATSDSSENAKYTITQTHSRIPDFTLKPIVDAAEVVKFCKADGTILFSLNTNGTPILRSGNGADFAIYVGDPDAGVYAFTVSGVSGDANARKLNMKPLADAGEVLSVQKADGTTLLDAVTSGTPGLLFTNAMALAMFSDNAVTEQLRMAAGYIQGAKIADPGTSPTGFGRLYFRDNGSGKGQLCVQFTTGTPIVLATEA